MLWKCLIKYKGTNKYVEELRHSKGTLQINPSEVQSTIIQLFRYKINNPPIIFTSSIDGKKYIVPDWIEVHPETTLSDIQHVRPKPSKIKPQIFKVKDYLIKYNSDKKLYTCNCQGYFRVKDKNIGCKHIQEVKKNLAN